jgi:hypothetical protein
MLLEGIDWRRPVRTSAPSMAPLVDALKGYVLSAEKLHGDRCRFRRSRLAQGKQKQDDCGRMFATKGRRAVKQLRQYGSRTRRIEKASIRPGISRIIAAFDRPTGMRVSTGSMNRAAW